MSPRLGSLALTLGLGLALAACGGKSAPTAATTPTLPGETSDTTDSADRPAGDTRSDADIVAAGPAAAPMSDEELIGLIEGSVSMTEQMVTAAREANKDCPLMAQKLEAVFTANADLMSRASELRAQPNIDVRMEQALSGDLGKRAGTAQEALGAELQHCSDSEDVAKLFERLYE
jgi:hypothetical protein